MEGDGDPHPSSPPRAKRERLECGKNNEIKDNEMAGTIDNGEES